MELIEDLVFPCFKGIVQGRGLFSLSSNFFFSTPVHVKAWISAEFVDSINDSLDLLPSLVVGGWGILGHVCWEGNFLCSPCDVFPPPFECFLTFCHLRLLHVDILVDGLHDSVLDVVEELFWVSVELVGDLLESFTEFFNTIDQFWDASMSEDLSVREECSYCN